MQELNGAIADVKRQQSSFETAELGRETRYQNLERQLNRLDDRIRAHAQRQRLMAGAAKSTGKPGAAKAAKLVASGAFACCAAVVASRV